jgi:transposase InsO family protein
MDDAMKTKLARVFYGGGAFMSGLSRFMNAVSNANIIISPEELKRFYENQTITQIFKKRSVRLQSNINRRSISQTEPFAKVYADTMFFTSKKEQQKFALICYIDGFSKYGFAYYVPLKGGDEKTSVSVSDGVKSVREYLGLIKEEFDAEPSVVFTDDGSEFSSAFVAELKSRDIDHQYGIAGDVLKNPIAERFNYSMRLLIEKFRSTYEPEEINSKMVNHIVERYNNLPTKGTGGLSPLEALDRVDDVKKFYRDRRSKQSRILIDNLPEGSYVRIALKKITDPFAKTIRQNWSYKVFPVSKFDKRKQRYVVDGKLYIPEELQKVDKELLDEYDMFNKIVKNPKEFEKPVKQFKIKEVGSEKERRIREIASLSPDEFNNIAIQAGYVSRSDPSKTTLSGGTRLEKANKIYDKLYGQDTPVFRPREGKRNAPKKRDDDFVYE